MRAGPLNLGFRRAPGEDEAADLKRRRKDSGDRLALHKRESEREREGTAQDGTCAVSYTTKPLLLAQQSARRPITTAVSGGGRRHLRRRASAGEAEQRVPGREARGGGAQDLREPACRAGKAERGIPCGINCHEELLLISARARFRARTRRVTVLRVNLSDLFKVPD